MTSDPPTYDHYEPVSLGPPLSGWRAVSVNEAGPIPPWRITPLFCWGVFHVTVRQMGTNKIVRDRGNVIEGVVPWPQGDGVGGLHPVREGSEFRYYLPPGAPEPTA